MATNLGEAITAAYDNYSGTLADNVTSSKVVLRDIMERDAARVEDGGVLIVQELEISNSGQTQMYNDNDQLTFAPYDTLDSATFDWKQSASPIYVTGREKRINMGKNRIHNIVKSKIRGAERDQRDSFGVQIQADGTGNGGDDIGGLALLVEDGSAWSTVGNIDSSVETYWQNQWTDFRASDGTRTFHDQENDRTAGLTVIDELYMDVKRQTDTPDYILVGKDLFLAIEHALQRETTQELRSDETVGKWGFRNFIYKGDVTVVYDEDVPANELLMLNTDYLHFVSHSDANFDRREWQRPDDRDAELTYILWMGNLTISNRARQGRITNLVV